MTSFVPQGGLGLMLARAAFDAGLFLLLGTLVFAAAVTQAPAHRRLARAAALLALAAGTTWLWLGSAWIASAETSRATLVAIPLVLAHTTFGLVLAAQLLAILCCLVLNPGRGSRLHAATILAAIATILQAGHGHAAAMAQGPSLLLASVGLHLLAGALWLGGLPALIVFIAGATTANAAAACRRFSPIAATCLALIVLTATLQFFTLVGIKQLHDTAYGRLAFCKILLLLGLAAVAANNRALLVPALGAARADRARTRLIVSIAGEILLGLCVLVAAALLASLPPGMDMTRMG